MITSKVPQPLLDLAARLEQHDMTTLNHCSRVGFVSEKLLPGYYSGVYLSPENAFLGGYLHDIGKLEIPASILNKPEKLSKEEIEIIKMHPRNGVELVKAAYQIDNIVLYIIGGHHEINGYPRREDVYVDSEKRNFGSRELLEKITIIDAFDALTDWQRPYNKKPLSCEEALEALIMEIPSQQGFAIKVKEIYEGLMEL